MSGQAFPLIAVSVLMLGTVGLAISPDLLVALAPGGSGDPAADSHWVLDQDLAFEAAQLALKRQYVLAQQAGAGEFEDGAPVLSRMIGQQMFNLETVQRLLKIKESTQFTDEAALQYIEAAARYQVATKGLEWSTDVPTPDHTLPSDAIRALVERRGGAIAIDQQEALQEMDTLPLELRASLADVVDAFHALELAAERAESDADSPIDSTSKSTGVNGGAPSFLPRLEGVADIFSARLQLARAAFELKAAVNQTGVEVPSFTAPASHGQQDHPDFDSDSTAEDGPFRICINSHGDKNNYDVDCQLLIDTGDDGNLYYNNAGGANAANSAALSLVSVLIDFGGNNQFGDPDNPRSEGANGGTYSTATSFAVGVLLSIGDGDDLYTSSSNGVGGGASGSRSIGFLFDYGGDDQYIVQESGGNGGAYSPGAANIGSIGSIIDAGGNDKYYSGSVGTNGGAAGFSSLGLSIDVGGNDQYVVEKDGVTLGSGVNGGANGATSGSYAFLADLSGDDIYRAGDNGVNGGSTSPGAAGFLFDVIGNDSYIAGDNAVNGGGSFGHGALFDFGGNDFYKDTMMLSVLEASCYVIYPSINEAGPCNISTSGGQGICHDCTIILKGDVAAGAGLGFQIDLPVTDTLGLDEGIPFDTDCDSNPPVDGASCRVNVLGQVIPLPPTLYGKQGDGQVGAVGARLGDDFVLTFTAFSPLATPKHDVCFRISADPGGDAALEFPDGAIAASGADLCMELDLEGDSAMWVGDVDSWGGQAAGWVEGALEEDGGGPTPESWVLDVQSWREGAGAWIREVRVRLHLGTVAGVYEVLAWNPIVPDSEVIFSATASNLNRIAILDDQGVEVTDLSIAAGQNKLFSARARDFENNDLGKLEVDWAVSNNLGLFNPTSSTDMATFTSSEFVGSGTISAYFGSISTDVDLIVVPGPLENIGIRDESGLELGAFEIISGQERTFRAFGYDIYGNLKGPLSVAWTRTGGGTISPTSGEHEAVTFTSDTVGLVRLKATKSGKDLTVDLNVVPAALDHIIVYAEPSEGGDSVTTLDGLTAGDEYPLYVAGYDQYENYISDINVNWVQNPENIVSFDENGVVLTAVRATSGTIIAQHPSLPESKGYAISIGEITHNKTTKLGFKSTPESVKAGESFSFDVEVQDRFGNIIGGHPPSNVFIELENGRSLIGTSDGETRDGAASFSDLQYTIAESVTLIARSPVDGEGDLVGEAQILITPAELDYISIRDKDGRSGPFNLIASNSRDFVAIGYDEYDNLNSESIEVDWKLMGVGGLTGGNQAAPVTFESNVDGVATLLAEREGIPTAQTSISVFPDSLDQLRIRDAANGGGNIVGGVLGVLEAGETKILYAAGYDKNNNYITDLGNIWTIEPPELGSFDAAGSVFTAERKGLGTITARQGGAEIVLQVEVVPGGASRLAFQDVPTEAQVAGREWPELVLRVEDAFGNLVSDGSHQISLRIGPGFDRALQGSLSVSTEAGVATFGDVSYPGVGAIWILAEAPGLQSAANGPYVVGPAILHSIVVQNVDGVGGLEELDLTSGEQINLYAVGRDVYGNTIDVKVAWNLDGAGRIASSGSRILYIAEGVGAAVLTVHQGDIQAQVHIRVSAGELDRIEVRDSAGPVRTIRISEGAVRTFSSVGYDDRGNTLLVQPTWSVEPPGLGSFAFTESGTAFTSLSPGSGLITARLGGVTATVRVVVDSTGGSPRADFAVTCQIRTCTFDAAASMPGYAEIADHAWDFGDGSFARGGIRTHTYAQAGTYHVVLVVTDMDGRTGEAVGAASPSEPPRPMVRLQLETSSHTISVDGVEIGVVVENMGDAPAPNVTLVFLVNGERIHTDVGGTLGPGASRWVNTTVPLLDGENELRVEAVGWAEESVLVNVAESPNAGSSMPPNADAPGLTAAVPLMAILAMLWTSRRRERH